MKLTLEILNCKKRNKCLIIKKKSLKLIIKQHRENYKPLWVDLRILNQLIILNLSKVYLNLILMIVMNQRILLGKENNLLLNMLINIKIKKIKNNMISYKPIKNWNISIIFLKRGEQVQLAWKILKMNKFFCPL